jgi:hypothetical protein
VFLTDRDRREALVLAAVSVVVIAMFVAVVLLDTGNQDQPDPIEARNPDGAEVAPTSTSTAPSSTAGPEVTTSLPPPPDSTATTAAPSGTPTTGRGTTSAATAPSAPPDPQDPGLPTDTVAPDTTLPSGPSFGDPVVIPRTVPPTTTPITQPTSTTTATTRPPPLTP